MIIANWGIFITYLKTLRSGDIKQRFPNFFFLLNIGKQKLALEKRLEVAKTIHTNNHPKTRQ